MSKLVALVNGRLKQPLARTCAKSALTSVSTFCSCPMRALAGDVTQRCSTPACDAVRSDSAIVSRRSATVLSAALRVGSKTSVGVAGAAEVTSEIFALSSLTAPLAVMCCDTRARSGMNEAQDKASGSFEASRMAERDRITAFDRSSKRFVACSRLRSTAI